MIISPSIFQQNSIHSSFMAEQYSIAYMYHLFFIHLSMDTSEKAMAPHSSTFAWRIPWMEEPGRLQSMGLLESDTTEAT